MASSILGGDCDNKTVGRADYFSKRLSLEDGDGSDAMRRLLLEKAEEWNKNYNDKIWERQLRGVKRKP